MRPTDFASPKPQEQLIGRIIRLVLSTTNGLASASPNYS